MSRSHSSLPSKQIHPPAIPKRQQKAAGQFLSPPRHPYPALRPQRMPPPPPPHFPLPPHRYQDIASLRLSTRSALTSREDRIPEPPRPQYDTMKAYDRLEKSGAISSLESSQQTIRPLFAYPRRRREFETPRREGERRGRGDCSAPRRDEDTVSVLLSDSIRETSDLLDSIFSSCSRGEERDFLSSSRTSLDFSSGLPCHYSSEREVWGSSPPIRNPVQGRPTTAWPSSEQKVWGSSPPIRNPARGRRSRPSSSPPPLRSSTPSNPADEKSKRAFRSSLQWPSGYEDWQSSPPTRPKTRRGPTISQSPDSDPSLQYLPSSPPPRLRTRHSPNSDPNLQYLPSSPSQHLKSPHHQYHHHHHQHSPQRSQTSHNTRNSPPQHNGTSSHRISTSPATMRYSTTILEEISEEDVQDLDARGGGHDVMKSRMRARWSVRFERVVGWVLGR